MLEDALLSTGQQEPVIFPGANALLELISYLLKRPTPRQRIPGQTERGDQPLPLVWLTGEPGQPQEFLRALSHQLDGEQQPRIVHALVDVTTEPVRDGNADGVSSSRPALLPLLDRLRHELSADRFGSGRLTRFDHYRLADMLTRQSLGVSGHKDDRADIVAMLRKWSGGNGPALSLDDASADLPPGFTRLGVRLVGAAGKVLKIRWLREKIPGLRAEITWFMRGQPYMIPKHSADFLGFAERLTVDRRDSESEDQLKKLLVHAFLEDLRIAYRRHHGRFLPRRSGWRRTTYVAALLSNVTETNDGGELLRLVNEVRNETGDLDPLLLIAASDEQPKSHPDAPSEVSPAANARAALTRWRRNLPRQRQRLARHARYLVLQLRRDGRFDSAEGSAWDELDDLRPPRAPGWARRGVIELVVGIAVVALLVPPAVDVRKGMSADCLNAPFSSGISVDLVEIAPGDEQCIGYSDSSSQVFGVTERLKHVQQAIFQQNEDAKSAHEEDPDRTYVSIVYFGALTHRNANVDTDDALAEDLEGILLRQQLQNAKSKSQPLLRVIVANGGEEMKKADVVARDMLAPLLTEDSTIIAVIGFDRTVTETEEAIRELGSLGVPAVGTPLTGSGLSNRSPLYFQIVPPNAKQAKLVADYAKYVHANNVVLIHPPLTGRDIYVRTLDDELQKNLNGSGITPADEAWDESAGDLRSMCSGSANHANDLVFYAGREEEFGDFLRAITDGCEVSDIPNIVGSDAISRFVAQRTSRQPSYLAGIKVSFVSMGSLVVLAGPRCVDGEANSTEGGTPLRAFCDGYHRLRLDLDRTLSREELPAAPWPGERIGLTYDTAGVLVEAVRQIRQHSGVASPHRAAVAEQLREMTFQGATGLINFHDSRIGDRRSLAILSISDIHQLSSIPRCTYLIGDLYKPTQGRQQNGCPQPAS